MLVKEGKRGRGRNRGETPQLRHPVSSHPTPFLAAPIPERGHRASHLTPISRVFKPTGGKPRCPGNRHQQAELATAPLHSALQSPRSPGRTRALPLALGIHPLLHMQPHLYWGKETPNNSEVSLKRRVTRFRLLTTRHVAIPSSDPSKKRPKHHHHVAGNTKTKLVKAPRASLHRPRFLPSRAPLADRTSSSKREGTKKQTNSAKGGEFK